MKIKKRFGTIARVLMRNCWIFSCLLEMWEKVIKTASAILKKNLRVLALKDDQVIVNWPVNDWINVSRHEDGGFNSVRLYNDVELASHVFRGLGDKLSRNSLSPENSHSIRVLCPDLSSGLDPNGSIPTRVIYEQV